MTQRPEDALEIVQREMERLWRDLAYHRHPAAHFAEQPWTPLADVVVSEHSARARTRVRTRSADLFARIARANAFDRDVVAEAGLAL